MSYENRIEECIEPAQTKQALNVFTMCSERIKKLESHLRQCKQAEKTESEWLVWINKTEELLK